MTPVTDDTLKRGKELISEVLSDPGGFSQYNELLSQFFKGLPIELLRKLLQHPNDRVISGALFITEELGKPATPLLNEIIAHFHNNNPRIRISAYNALGSCISRDHESEFVHVVLAIQDPDIHCRKIAMLWMMRVPDAWLRAALKAIERSDSNTDIQQALRMLLGEFSSNPAQIRSWMQDESALLRQIGVIAAGRMAEMHPNLLELAVKSEDVDLRECGIAQIRFRKLRRRNKME